MPPKQNIKHLKEWCVAQGLPELDMKGTIADLPAIVLIKFMENVQSVQETMNSIQAKITGINSKIAAIEGTKAALDAHIKADAEDKVKSIRRLERLESESRKRSIIIGGLDCGGLPCAKAVSKFLSEDMKVHITFVAAFHVSKPAQQESSESKPPLIKVILRDSGEKAILFKNAKQLKGSGTYIREDLTQEERENRKLLVKLMNSYRDKGKDASVRGKILSVDGQKYHFKKGKLCTLDSSGTPMEL
jgi:hypothetical protein